MKKDPKKSTLLSFFKMIMEDENTMRMAYTVCAALFTLLQHIISGKNDYSHAEIKVEQLEDGQLNIVSKLVHNDNEKNQSDPV